MGRRGFVLPPEPRWQVTERDRDCAWCGTIIEAWETALIVYGILARSKGDGEALLTPHDIGAVRWYCPNCVIELWRGRFGAEQRARIDWLTVQDEA